MMDPMFSHYDMMKQAVDFQVSRIKEDYREAQDPSFLGRLSPVALLIGIVATALLKIR